MFREKRALGHDADELLAILASKSRDNSRTPVPWNAQRHGGFTTGEPWIALGDNGQEINVEAALNDPDSVFYTYQTLIRLRKTLPLLTEGNYHDCLPEHTSLWSYRRHWQGQTLQVVANLSSECQRWQPENTDGSWQRILSNYDETSDAPGDMTLRPFEAVWWLQQ